MRKQLVRPLNIVSDSSKNEKEERNKGPFPGTPRLHACFIGSAIIAGRPCIVRTEGNKNVIYAVFTLVKLHFFFMSYGHVLMWEFRRSGKGAWRHEGWRYFY